MEERAHQRAQLKREREEKRRQVEEARMVSSVSACMCVCVCLCVCMCVCNTIISIYQNSVLSLLVCTLLIYLLSESITS